MDLYPLTFEPVFKDYLWGGRGLEKLGRQLPPGVTAESWEIAAHEDGTTVVNNGHFAGWSLIRLQAEFGLDLIGSRNKWATERGKFPLLVKLLDANRSLSVQVHPDDAFAAAHEGNELGKSEMWLVLDAKPGAKLVFGVKAGTTPGVFRQAITRGELEQYLHFLTVKTGDHICVPSGSLHAILDGILIAEIQQNSNTTYRVYDWNRVDKDGLPRPLHVEQALEVINFSQVEPGLDPPTLLPDMGMAKRQLLCRNQYFTTERLELGAGGQLHGSCNGETLEIWGVIKGSVFINGVFLSGVRFCLLPAAMGDFKVEAVSDATLLRTYVE